MSSNRAMPGEIDGFGSTVAVPAAAASIEVYADNTLVPAQQGGTYELVFTP